MFVKDTGEALTCTKFGIIRKGKIIPDKYKLLKNCGGYIKIYMCVY